MTVVDESDPYPCDVLGFDPSMTLSSAALPKSLVALTNGFFGIDPTSETLSVAQPIPLL
jgi:hypothetical protein